MQKRKLVGLTKQLFIVRGNSDDDVYLCQIGLKAQRDISKEES